MLTRGRVLYAWCAAFILVLSVASSAIAQQATPNSSVVQNEETRSFPATINEGTCDQVGTLWYELAPVGLPEGGQIVAPPAVPAYESVTTIPGTLVDNFANGKYVLAIGRSQESPQEIVACGFIGGTRYGDNLLFSILPKGDSNDFGGVVMLTQAGEDVLVTIHLMSGVENSDATPVPSASPDAAAATPGMLSTESPE